VTDDGLLVKNTQLVIPKSLRNGILEDLHAGHPGILHALGLVKDTVFWPGINNEVEMVVRGCRSCQEGRPSNSKEPLVHLPIAERPFEHVSADWFDLNGRKYLVISEWYSGMFEVKGPTKQPNAEQLIKYFKEWVKAMAIPEHLWTDGGPPFGSEEVNSFLAKWGIRRQASSPHFPQGNSMAELAVKQSKSLLRKCLQGRDVINLKTEDRWIQRLLEYCNTPNANG
jgi:hypothetical protein